MINCTVLNITQIIVILILLTVLLIQNCGKKRRNKLLKGIDMTILEISIPGCESFCCRKMRNRMRISFEYNDD